jgi:crotonobetainyl-CoA:carnitine CoA-transferase CaiB-like acyl-CoA transferase
MRQRTGLGQHVDMAMVDATLVTDDQIHYELERSEETMGLPNDVWETGAGPILVSADFRHLFRSLQRGLGFADPAEGIEDLQAKIAARRGAVDAFMRGLADFDAVEAAMAKINIAWGRVRRGHDLGEQPTLRHRGSIAQVDDRAGGTRPIPQSPYRFSAARSGVRAGAPHRGEHNREVLAEWLGLGDADVEALTAAGVLADQVPQLA